MLAGAGRGGFRGRELQRQCGGCVLCRQAVGISALNPSPWPGVPTEQVLRDPSPRVPGLR